MATVSVRGRVAVGAGLAGVLGLAAGAVLIVLLAVVPPTDAISVTRSTISQYGLSAGKGVFDLAVLLVAAGSGLILAVLWVGGRLPVASLALGGLWTLCLLVIVAVPKANWAVVSGFDLGGTVHRGASLVGFLCLPVGILLAARRAFPAAGRWRLVARLLSLVSLAWFAVILAAVVIGFVGGLRWWEIIPLGLVERGMALTELVALSVLAGAVSRGGS